MAFEYYMSYCVCIQSYRCEAGSVIALMVNDKTQRLSQGLQGFAFPAASCPALSEARTQSKPASTPGTTHDPKIAKSYRKTLTSKYCPPFAKGVEKTTP